MNLMITTILSAISLRGAARVMDLFCSTLLPEQIRIPSWYTSRLWLLKLGHYKLTRAKEHADDWIWIVDHSVQWGVEKCLLILGIRAKDLPKNRALAYHDLEPIELLPVTKSNGEIVYEQLIQAANKTGIPKSIVSDGGSDLSSGIKKFTADHKYTIYIYDIKHKVALLVKEVLESDTAWASFIEFSSIAQSYMRQSDVAALAPPNQRSKARYMNVDILVNWAKKVLNIPEEKINKLFKTEEKERLLGWLDNFSDDIERWTKIITIADAVITFVSINGLYRGITDDLINILPESPCGSIPDQFQEKILTHLAYQEYRVYVGDTIVGSSDVIESVFGKFKNIEKEQSSSGFTNLLLALPAILAETSADIIKQAMEATKTIDVWNWLKNNIGHSVQAKKKMAFSSKI